MASSTLNIAGYRFTRLPELRPLRARLQRLCQDSDLKGTILLSPEGINLFVAGEPHAIAGLLTELRALPGLADFTARESWTARQPFRRMLVRLKKEIIAFGIPGIDPARHSSRRLSPAQLRQWLDEGRELTLLDTRNDYEVQLGTFSGALPIGIRHFREFPAAVARLPASLKERPLVMFCTGGIRCEKAGPFMEQAGFGEVYQLEGGILKYFEECGGRHYEGECFVFDQRVGLDAGLQQTDTVQCFICQSPLTSAEQEDSRYVTGRSCPYCFRTAAEQQSAILATRHEQIAALARTLPVSEPADHDKPVNVPAACDGMTVLQMLNRLFGHVEPAVWEERLGSGRILDGQHRTVTPAHRVRAGERYLHRLPAVIEPDVNLQLRILYEDEALLVLNKPAPLPMHPGGRFLRNTLQHLLEVVYAPQKPRPAHRLDANTTGAVLVARTRHFASQLQPLFERGEIGKSYLARVRGVPRNETFTCEAPIAADATELGARLVDQDAGLPARTEFRVRRVLPDGTTLLEVRPLTGRTNQIRLHLAWLNLPVCGDQAYLGRHRLGEVQTLLPTDAPLCLHAWRLHFVHPVNGRQMSFEAPPPGWASEEMLAAPG